MIFSGPFLVQMLRWIPPATVIIGTSATYMNVMALLNCLALILPARTSSRLETYLYSSYQRMVGFWFETWSGVEVGVAHSKRWVWPFVLLVSVLFLW